MPDTLSPDPFSRHTLSEAASMGATDGSHRSIAALRTAGIAIAGSGFIALCAHISLPLLFSPVPLTMQPFAVILVALLLAPGVAFSTLVLYLAEGAAGLPVFTPHGLGGMVQLLGPTGGYLLSYPFVAAMVSWLARRATPGFAARIWAGASGNILILVSGAVWLSLLTHANAKTIVSTTILPFLPGDALKVIAAAALATAWMRYSSRKSRPAGEGSSLHQ